MPRPCRYASKSPYLPVTILAMMYAANIKRFFPSQVCEGTRGAVPAR